MYSRKGQYKTSVEFIKDTNTKLVNHSPSKHKNNVSQFPSSNQQIKYIQKDVSQQKNHEKDKNPTNLQWETSEYNNTSDPSVWGPPLWFTLHICATKYPLVASNIQKSHMKGFILGLPIMLPCIHCKTHAYGYIKKADTTNELEEAISGQEKLFKWFHNFHNAVNERLKKKQMSYDDAYNIYYNNINVSKLTYH
jgi:hypothetical protein